EGVAEVQVLDADGGVDGFQDGTLAAFGAPQAPPLATQLDAQQQRQGQGQDQKPAQAGDDPVSVAVQQGLGPGHAPAVQRTVIARAGVGLPGAVVAVDGCQNLGVPALRCAEVGLGG